MDSLTRGSTVLKNLQIIEFTDSRYALTYASSLALDLDSSTRSFLVYKCDETGVMCSFIKSVYEDGFYSTAYSGQGVLTIDPATNALYLQIGDEKTLIANSN